MTKQNAQGSSGGMQQPKNTTRQEQQRAENGDDRQQGDNRTPDEPIGEVAYANRDPAKKKTGEF